MSLPRIRSATSLRIVSSERVDVSACRLFLTRRAAKPAVAAPSTKRTRLSEARASLISSAESTSPITICITVPRGCGTSNTQLEPSGKCRGRRLFLFVAGTIQNKDVTGPIPELIISIHCPRGALQRATYSRHVFGFDMRTSRKIWLGVGAFVVVETAATAALAPLVAGTPSGLSARRVEPADGLAMDRILIAQQAEHGQDAGEAGEAESVARLPPNLAFGVRIALLRGHLLVGDELVRQQQWNAALPHFLHPTEEIYGDIKGELGEDGVPPFDAALKTRADVVKAKKGGADYARALKSVNDALAAADAGMKAKQSNWSGFVVEAAVEALKAAAGEYQQAIVGGRIAKPVEYQ